MSGLQLNLAAPIRTAIMGNDLVTVLLSTWTNEPAVFTRRPVPDDAIYPMIVVSPDISVGDMDGLTMRAPIVRRDIVIYGEQDRDYRTIEDGAYLLRQQFHRQRLAIDVPGYSVIDIRCIGPMAAPVDDEKLVGRAVLCTFRLRDLAT